MVALTPLDTSNEVMQDIINPEWCKGLILNFPVVGVENNNGKKFKLNYRYVITKKRTSFVEHI